MKLLIRWFVVAIVLVVAVALIPGIRVEDTNAWISVGVIAAVLDPVNAIIRSILAFLSCGCIVATLGLFMLAITPPALTNMLYGTPGGIMEQEATFLALLPPVAGYYIEGDSLYLEDASRQVMAELVAYQNLPKHRAGSPAIWGCV